MSEKPTYDDLVQIATEATNQYIENETDNDRKRMGKNYKKDLLENLKTHERRFFAGYNMLVESSLQPFFKLDSQPKRRTEVQSSPIHSAIRRELRKKYRLIGL